MSGELRHVQNLKFMNITFRVFDYEGKLWIPLADLARGLGYANPKMLWKLVSGNPQLFDKQGWILDLKAGTNVLIPECEIVSRRDTISTGNRGPVPSLLTTHEGVMMCLMLNRSAKADEFKVWACKRLVPAMIRKAHRQTPLDDMTPEQRIAYLREKSKLRRMELERKMKSSPIWNARQLVHETNELYITLSRDGRDTATAFQLLSDARELLDALKERRDGPTLFK